jgi:cysteine desulfurase
LTAYLDNSATTKPCEQALAAVKNACENAWGNPSSLHRAGLDSRLLVEQARKSVAKKLGCEEKELYFSPSGTAANNTALFGAAKANRRYGKKIVCSSIEHPSVMRCIDALGESGFEIIKLSPDKNGVIPVASLEDAIDEGTCLVSMMAVNNETGAIQPFDEVKRIIRRKKSHALFHMDAVQAFCKIPVKSSVADLISVSAHKIHGIKGAGALYVSKAVKIKPYILGGGQESNMFSGTHAVPAISAFGAAADASPDFEKTLEKVGEINSYLRTELEKIDGVSINSPDNALCYILNISVLGVPSQVSVNALSEMGVFVSAGSACSKGHRSDTLVSMGLDSARIDSAIRISLSGFTKKEEIDLFIGSLKEVIKQVRGE